MQLMHYFPQTLGGYDARRCFHSPPPSQDLTLFHVGDLVMAECKYVREFCGLDQWSTAFRLAALHLLHD